MAPIDQRNRAVLIAEADSAFDLVIMRVIRALTGFLPRAHWWVRSTLFSGTLLVITVGLSLLIGNPNNLLPLEIWAATLTLAALLSFERISAASRALINGESFASLDEAALARIATRLSAFARIRYQIWTSVAFGLGTAAVVGGTVFLVSGVVAPFVYVQILVGTASTVNMMYSTVLVTAITGAMRHESGWLFPVEPHAALIVREVLRVTTIVGLAAAVVAAVAIVGPFLIPGMQQFAVVLAALALVGWVSAIVQQFVQQHRNMARLASNRRNHTLNELQSELSELYAQRTQLDDEQRARFEYLLQLHDRVSGSRGQVENLLGSSLRFTVPFILPLISLLVSSGTIRGLPLDILQVALETLGQ